jgi:class 3 adenylate cyclase/tetratricopeptide (TPR) repeat protein
MRCPACGFENSPGLKFCGECGARLPLAGPPREVRKTVTVLFSDVAGSTALGERLDPESLRALMSRYFDEIRAIIERHGGTVEKFIGDAVMAVFGIPVLHEDDALRAVRAAAEIRDRLIQLSQEFQAQRGVGLTFRTGVYTGEVVAGDARSGQTLVTGDTVNTAARLEQASAPGEILLGESTHRLVRDAVSAEAVAPISAKGKAALMHAYRLIHITPGAEGHSRRFDAPLVGRHRELERLQREWEDSVAERSCHLFTLLGSAGVGKSRLVREFLAALPRDTHVLRGRCLSYGEGITYWPLADALKSAASISETDSPGTARGKLQALLAREREAETLSARLASAIGLSADPAPRDEIFWAARRTFESLARRAPLVLVFDDIQWAEPTFLELVEHIADWSRDTPLLLLCMARPELLDTRPAWGGGKLHATTVLLEPLTGEAADRLIDGLPGGSALPPLLRARIADAAEGNPLFVEEMLVMLRDEGKLIERDGTWYVVGDLEAISVPASISVLLGARLERLAPEERAIAERASVVGRIFERDAVRELSPETERSSVTAHLLALVRKELVRREEQPGLGGAEAYRFRHLLIRDAAYQALPKAERATLHERFANWLERVTGQRAAEYHEIIGHHLEQAYRYRLELGEAGEHLGPLGHRAASVCFDAARRALDREDLAGALALLAQLRGLPPLEGRHAEVLETEAKVRRGLGDFEAASALYSEMEAVAVSEGKRAARLRAAVSKADVDVMLGTASAAEATAAAMASVPALEEAGDESGLALAWQVIAGGHASEMRWAELADATEKVLHHAANARDVSVTVTALNYLGMALTDGPSPAREAIHRLRAIIARRPPRGGEGAGRAAIARLLVLRGEHEAAEREYERGYHLLTELGKRHMRALCAVMFGQALGHVGADARAEAITHAAFTELRELGATYTATTAAAVVAVARLRLGLLDEVDELMRVAREAPPDDVATSSYLADATALLALSRNDVPTAIKHARHSVELLRPTQATLDQAEAHVVLGEVLRAAGHDDDADRALRDALSLFEAKGATACIARVRRLINGDVARSRLSHTTSAT